MSPEKQKYVCYFRLNGNQGLAPFTMPTGVNELIPPLQREADMGRNWAPHPRTGYYTDVPSEVLSVTAIEANET